MASLKSHSFSLVYDWLVCRHLVYSTRRRGIELHTQPNGKGRPIPLHNRVNYAQPGYCTNHLRHAMKWVHFQSDILSRHDRPPVPRTIEAAHHNRSTGDRWMARSTTRLWCSLVGDSNVEMVENDWIINSRALALMLNCTMGSLPVHQNLQQFNYNNTKIASKMFACMKDIHFRGVSVCQSQDLHSIQYAFFLGPSDVQWFGRPHCTYPNWADAKFI